LVCGLLFVIWDLELEYWIRLLILCLYIGEKVKNPYFFIVMKIIVQIFCLVCLARMVTIGQIPTAIPVNFIDQHAGLNDTKNFFLYQDSDDIMWISSEAGLHQFDGTEIRVFLPDDGDPNSIQGRNVLGMINEDEDKNLWFCTDRAINCYVRNEDRFVSFSLPDDPGLGYFSCGLDSLHQLWFANQSKLYTFDIISHQFSFVYDLIVNGNRTYTVLDPEGKVSFVYCYNQEVRQIRGFQLLDLRDPSNVKSKVYFDQIHHSPSRVKDVWADGDSVLWVVGHSALFSFDIQNERWQRYGHRIQDKDIIFRAIEPLNDTILLIASYADGLFSFNTHTLEFGEIFQLMYQNQALEEPPQYIYKDRHGGLWITIGYRGVAYYHPENLNYRHYRHTLETPISRSRVGLSSLVNLDDGTVFGTSLKHGGMIFRDAQTILNHFHKHNTPGIVANAAINSYKDAKGRIWMLTEGPPSLGGTDGSFRSLITPDTSSFESICTLPSGDVLLGSRREGLFQSAESGSGKITLQKITRPGLDKKFNFLMLKDDLVYAAVNKQYLEVYDPADDFHLIRSVPFSLDVNCMVPDPFHDRIWIGSENGLYYFKMDMTTPMALDWPACIDNVKVVGVMPYEENELWISTGKGIFKLNLEEESCTPYEMQFGLKGKLYERFCTILRPNG